jgi:hypothetical protein
LIKLDEIRSKASAPELLIILIKEGEKKKRNTEHDNTPILQYWKAASAVFSICLKFYLRGRIESLPGLVGGPFTVTVVHAD